MPTQPIAWIDETGYHRLRLDEILSLVNDRYYSIFGTGMDIDSDTEEGQQIGAWGEMIAGQVELGEGVYLGRSRAGAVGTGLSRLMQLIGATRKKAQYSMVAASLTGTPGTPVPAGSLVNTTASPPVSFQTLADVTIGDSGTATVTLRASVPGPLRAAANTLTAKVTVISGWDTITNPTDATPGRLYEEDGAARARMALSVALPSQGISDGLEGALLNLDGVADCKVFVNDTDTVNALGMVRHSIWAVVDGGDPVDIANMMWIRKAPGCSLNGSVTQDITDSQGLVHTMRFDRPTDVPIYATLRLAALPGTDVVAAIKNAIAAYGPATYEIGKSVQWFKLGKPITEAAPDVDVISLFLGTAPTPTLEADVAILPTQVSRWDVSRIVVTT